MNIWYLLAVPEFDRLATALADLQTEIQRADNLSARSLGVGQAEDLQVIRLLHASGALKVSEIARRRSSSTATSSARIDRLDRRGLVERRRDVSDRRVVVVQLTALGKKSARQSVRSRRQILADVNNPQAATDAIEDLTRRYRDLHT